MLKLKVENRSLRLLLAYFPNAMIECQAFVDEVNDAFQRVRSIEFTVLLMDFNAHIETSNEKRKGVIGRHRDAVFNKSDRYLLQLCCSNGLCVINIISKQKYAYTTYSLHLV